jgi:hypothetical protein
MTGAGVGNNRIYLRNIKGQPLLVGFDLSHCYDVAYIDAVHFWPFWSVDANVINYMRANAFAYVFKRVDNPKIGRLFGAGYSRVLAFLNQPSVGLDTNLPGGSTGLFHADVVGSSNCSIGLLVDSAVNGATVYIDQFYGGADPAHPSGEPIINVVGSNGDVSINRFFGFQSASLVSQTGAGSTLTIGESRSASISGTEFNIGAGTLRLEATPKTSAPIVYAGAGIIETPEWRSFTPVLSTTSGALTTASATGKFRRVGKTVSFQIGISIANNGTGSGEIVASLPFVSAAQGNFDAVGRENAQIGKTLHGRVPASQASMVIGNYDNTYPGLNGASISVAGTYEAA